MMTRRMKRKRKTKKIGRRSVLFLLGGLALPSLAKDKNKKKEREPQALVAGTIFRNTGHALRGAEVSVVYSESGRKGAWKGLSDSRGEFAVRIPAGAASYTVSIKAEGFRTQQKSVTVSADERIDLSFLMEPK